MIVFTGRRMVERDNGSPKQGGSRGSWSVRRVPVRDYTSAVKWYELLRGAEASFYPHEVEAVWQLAEDRYVYIVKDQERAGGAVNMIWVDDPVAEAARIPKRGLEPVDVEKHDTVWKYVFHDADGNEVGVGGNVPSSEAG
jgi:hypothetical protein